MKRLLALLAVLALGASSEAEARGKGRVSIPEKDFGKQIERQEPVSERPRIPERDWADQQRRNPTYTNDDLKCRSRSVYTGEVWHYAPTPNYGTFWNLNTGQIQSGWHYKRSN